MDFRKLIKINLINLGILGLIVVFYFVTQAIFGDSKSGGMETVTGLMTIAMGALWMAYAIYSNVVAIKEDDLERLDEIKRRLTHAGRKGYYIKERTHMMNMLDSLENRKKYFLTKDDSGKLKDLYIMTRSQMIRNATNISEYIETFDYISGVDSGYVKQVCKESQDLLNRFNKLVELTVTYDDTALDYDTREIDDMIESLEEMRETGRKPLGS